MGLFSQQNRDIRIQTSLAPDKLLLSSMHGSEGISRLFTFELSLISEDSGIDFNSVIGQSATVSVEIKPEKIRYFNGIVSRFSQVTGTDFSADDTTRVSRYRATLVPKLWLLTRSAESMIFQDKTVPEIVQTVLNEHGISDVDMRVQSSNYEKRDYCVQYRETHFNFISRLLEDEGIHYYFEHNARSHRLIISDASKTNPDCPLQNSASCHVEGSSPEDDVIDSIDRTQEIRPKKYLLGDYNFEKPNGPLMANVGDGKRGGLEIYDYPGDYPSKKVGDRMVVVRIEEEEAQLTSISGSGSCRAFTPGYRFTLLNAYRRDMNNKKYLLTSVAHSLSQSYERGGGSDYGNSFTCIPGDVPFRPPRITPKPVVEGTQTAIVAGPSGEEIYTDEYSRIKVQFHWDRLGQRDDKSSCWIRVAQAWAGAGWGSIYIPRVGQEVVVNFIEGDPDRPLITGCVYHALNKPPYALPGEKTKSTIKTYASPGGGGFNEIRLEDKKGAEQLFIHAEKQMDVRVKQDSLEWIGNERHLIVTTDQLEKVNADKHLEVTGDQNEKIGGTMSLETGQDLQQKIGGKYCNDSGMEIHLKAGMKAVIEAGTQLSLKVGGNFIDIGPAGVTITGTLVQINSGGSAGSGSGATPNPPKTPKEADKG